MKKIYLPILLLLCGTLSITDTHAKKKSVLFIGNSYIHTNNMPQMLASLCTANGDTLIKDENTPGGYTLESHTSDPATDNKITTGNWDVVILQEQSQRPAFHPSQVANDVYPYATYLNNTIKDHDSCTEVMFMMTWGYRNGDPSNCGAYPPICTYEGMQNGLRNSYMQMGQDNKANVAPVGAAWKVVRDSFPAIDLYSPDNSHPSLSGSYLEACVLYASIFHKSPYGNTYTAGLPAADVEKLQYVAELVTLDSLEQWQQHGNMVSAKFQISRTALDFAFQNLSKRATSYNWDFGDGNTSIAQDPTHTYAADGIYTIRLTAENKCDTEVYSLTYSTYPDAVANIEEPGNAYVYTLNGSNYLKLDTKPGFNKLSVYDMNGKKVIERQLREEDNNILLQVVPGIYVYKLSGNKIATGKFSQQ